MDREGNSSSSRTGNTPGARSVEASQNNESQSGITTDPNAEANEKKAREIKPEVWVAIITGITGILVALFSFPPFIALFAPVAIATAVETPFVTSTSTHLPTGTTASIVTETTSPTPAPSLTSTSTATAIPSETATLLPQPKLIVLLEANKTSGKAPVIVKLDARTSYMTDLDGQTYVCRNGACYFTWKVYSNGQQIGKSVTDSGGTFDYKLGKKGIYTITVWVCRGKDGMDCGGSGIQIAVS